MWGLVTGQVETPDVVRVTSWSRVTGQNIHGISPHYVYLVYVIIRFSNNKTLSAGVPITNHHHNMNSHFLSNRHTHII